MPKGRPKRRQSDDARFAEAVKAKLSEKSLTLTAVAKEMDVPDDRVRQWITRNRFPESQLLRLSAVLGLPTDISELKSEYGVQTTTHGRLKAAKFDVPETIRSVLGPRIPDLEEDDFGADVKRFLRCMEPGGIFVVWSVNQLPFEFTNVGWRAVGTAVASAIFQKQIYCIYAHPDKDELGRLRDVCGLRNLPHVDYFETAFEQFVKNLSVTELRDLNTETLLMEGGQRTRLSTERIKEHVVRVAAPSAAFCAPHHRYVVFIPADQSGKPPSALARFPTGASRKPLLLPLEEEAAFDLYDFLITCLKAKGKHRETQVVKLLAPLAVEAEPRGHKDTNEKTRDMGMSGSRKENQRSKP